jgi:hypothetical protein
MNCRCRRQRLLSLLCSRRSKPNHVSFLCSCANRISIRTRAASREVGTRFGRRSSRSRSSSKGNAALNVCMYVCMFVCVCLFVVKPCILFCYLYRLQTSPFIGTAPLLCACIKILLRKKGFALLFLHGSGARLLAARAITSGQ